MTHAMMILVLVGSTMTPCDGADRLAGLVDDVLLAWSEEEMHLWGVGRPWDRAEDEPPPVHLCDAVSETFAAVGAVRREERPPVLLPPLVSEDAARGAGPARPGAPDLSDDSSPAKGRKADDSPAGPTPVVPEPLTCTLLVLGGGALLSRRPARPDRDAKT